MSHLFEKLGTAIVGGVMLLMSSQILAAETVSLRLSYTPFASHIPVYVAQAKGYYAEGGVSVDILPGRGSTFAAMTVGAGKEAFGIADAAAVLAARAKGVPIVAVGNLQQDNGVALIATVKSGISKVEDLKGRNIGVFPGSTTNIFLQALLKKHGLSLDDVKPVTWRSGTDLPLLLDGKIDAEVTVYNNEVVTWGIEHPELKLRVWPMAKLGFDTPGYALVTSEEFAQKNAKLVAAVTKATFRGSAYAVQHPDEAVAILVKAAPELNANIEAAQWRETAAMTNPAGTLDRGKWGQLNELLKTYGVIDAKVNLDAVLNDSFR